MKESEAFWERNGELKFSLRTDVHHFPLQMIEITQIAEVRGRNGKDDGEGRSSKDQPENWIDEKAPPKDKKTRFCSAKNKRVVKAAGFRGRSKQQLTGDGLSKRGALHSRSLSRKWC